MGEAKRRAAAIAQRIAEGGRTGGGAHLAILNVGDGDTKISFDKSNPEERERAKRIVQDMLRRGYAILVQVGERDGKALYYRATSFDPETCEYIVAGVPEEEVVVEEPAPKKLRGVKRVSAEGARAVSVARSAGGMSTAANSVEADNARKLANMRDHDPLYGMRRGLKEIAAVREQWAGIPMPLADHNLVIEPKYPRAAELMAVTRAAEAEPPKVRNRFYSSKLRSDVIVRDKDGGGVDWGISPAIHSLTTQVTTMGASEVWGIEQEAAAVQLLGTLIPHHAFKKYMLTGSFLESSQRCRVTYMFRRLRPTVAISMSGKEPRVIAALCMHPIAYYEGSWAGAMCPTDDVVAHLMLMRGDERMFWRRCNQHPAWRPEAGL